MICVELVLQLAMMEFMMILIAILEYAKHVIVNYLNILTHRNLGNLSLISILDVAVDLRWWRPMLYINYRVVSYATGRNNVIKNVWIVLGCTVSNAK